MKKLFNNRFLIILAMSLLALIGLGVLSFYLFDDSDAKFVKSGYVINPLSEGVTKYFFSEDVSYHENLKSMIEFVDVDKNKVEVVKDSFVHYNDSSISFLKKGAILDLDSINGDNAVKFYNIGNKSIVDRDKNGYSIDSVNGKIELKNFIGRINENKYIVVGNVKLKVPGNETLIDGDYFEFVFPKLGVVNIENKDNKFQVTSEGTYLYLGNNIVIDLGSKVISKNNEDIMSITEIIIDGDENIEIIPHEEDKDNEENNNGNETGTGDSQNDNQGNAGNGDSPDNNDGNGTNNGDGTDKPEEKEELSIVLKNAFIGSTNIDVTFSIANNKEDDVFKLQVVNMSTGRTVDIIEDIIDDTEYRVGLLSPKTKYLFTIINKKDNVKYFQKIFETSGFGIKLEKAYATDSVLAYKITVDEDTDITDATLSLYRFNEESKKNEIVKTSYYDTELEEVVYVDKVIKLSTLEGNLSGEYEVIFDNLDSDTIYTAVLDEFSTTSTNFKDIYNINLTSMTLKETPHFSEMRATKDVGKGSFELSLGNIIDPDNAIVNYTYLVYETNSKKQAIPEIKKTNASPIKIDIGNKDNELKNDTNYFYKVIIEYYDNEKYIEYVTEDSINFLMGSDPYVTVIPNDNLISYDTISATIYLIDNSCLISVPDRERCDGESSTVVTVRKINSLTGDFESNAIFSETVDFKVENGEVKYDLLLDGLQAGTSYNIEVKAFYNDREDRKYIELAHTDESKRNLTTKTLRNFLMEWKDAGSSANHVVNLDAKLIADEKTGTLSSDESANAIKKVVLRLYEGNHISDIQSQTYIAKREFVNDDKFNIKEEFYDKAYNITSDGTFSLELDDLKELNEDGKLSEYYTISLVAYYDNGNVGEVLVTNNITSYAISPILLLENISDPELRITNIVNKDSNKLFGKLNNGGTVVGYKALAIFPSSELINQKLIPQKINFYVYNETGKLVKFYVKKNSSELELVDSYSANLGEEEYYELEIYMDYGTDYYTKDLVMSRGNSYYVGYTISLMDTISNKQHLFPNSKGENQPSDFGLYINKIEQKETPKVQMYVASSDSHSITYNYLINDPDKALYKEEDKDTYGMYYTINGLDEARIDLTFDSDIKNNTLVLDGLNNGDEYLFYYKKNVTKTNDIEKDVVNYLDNTLDVNRVFDGYYDLSRDNNFVFNVINNQLIDNKVVIKFGRDDYLEDSLKIIDRIASFKITFNDGEHTLEKEMWKLEECSDGSYRCLSVDYLELKEAGMKSTESQERIIRVSVSAIYDNGLTGYDLEVGGEYPYMILQKNLTTEGPQYISFRNSGQLAIYDNTEFGRGYYTYSLKGKNLSYKSEFNNKLNTTILVSLGSSGYNSSFGAVNPKMMSVNNLKSSNNTFSFSSITPKVKSSDVTSLLDGGVVNLNLSGIDLADVWNENSGSNKSPAHYLYVDTWDVSPDEVLDAKIVRPTLKVLINEEAPTSTIMATIDGLTHGRDESSARLKYYYRVYACMYKGNGVNDSRCGAGYSYTQLFDANVTNKYEAKTYTFSPYDTTDVFQNLVVDYEMDDSVYGNKNLKTRIGLIPYRNQVPFDFDITYMLCEVDDTECGLNKNNIFKSTISADKVKSPLNDIKDITEYDLEHDKNYYMYVYANVKKYDSNNGSFVLNTSDVLLNRYSLVVKLKKLVEPSFVVTREAVITDDGDYALDFGVTVNDPDRTLDRGKYFVKLEKINRGPSGNIVREITGELQVLDRDGNYVTINNYTEYEFDALVPNKKIRITGLDSDSEYRFTVYNKAYINNYDENVPKEERVKDISKYHTVATAADYGVAFGKNITYSVTEKNIVVTFLGGSKFDNVKKVMYTIGLWDAEHDMSSYSETDIIGEDNKYFQIDKESGEWSYVLAPNGMKNQLNQSFKVKVVFYVETPDGDMRIVELAEATTVYKE